MAKKTIKNNPWDNYHCGECGHAYNWHHPAVDGHMTLAKCPYVEVGCVISSQRACKNYKPKETNEKTTVL